MVQNASGLSASKPFASKILGMPASFSSHALVRIGSVPVDVAMDDKERGSSSPRRIGT